ncbi:family 16 glycosylhydrolase [Stenotrophomonas sp.]|uniref:family 16 glycosylhydrolase n=1 Tax=Stenotrophomonas sp. TaxID=69392 RepID=UPI00289AD07B|nr:family 16 glycosylhydrolase [Stenotrophomonas sp.]
MNLTEVSSALGGFLFRASRLLFGLLPRFKISAFGPGADEIGAIIVVNLDRQPERWRRVTQELRRFRTRSGVPLEAVAMRFSAVDARDGSAVAPTADVDPIYSVGDQLFVQPDSRLERCFSLHEPITMTRQEVAVARSHIEVWKAIVAGDNEYVLVLEDDVWFRWNAALTISRGWQAALRRSKEDGGPRMLYLSYQDAGGTAERIDECEFLFRPVRGLWFLSGYVLSRGGAAALLRAMPVVGPVDLWMNYRFGELGSLALPSPAILQRHDAGSDNAYSALPYLARAGAIDARSFPASPPESSAQVIMVWTGRGEREGLAMALAMLGFRVRVFDGDEEPLRAEVVLELLVAFDALVDVPLAACALHAVIDKSDAKFFVEADGVLPSTMLIDGLPCSRTVRLMNEQSGDQRWKPICEVLGIPLPVQPFPVGAPRDHRVFRDDRPVTGESALSGSSWTPAFMDESPWILPTSSHWRPRAPGGRAAPAAGQCLVREDMRAAASSSIAVMNETFPGNLASFAEDGFVCDEEGAHLCLVRRLRDGKPYCSGAFASIGTFPYGRFEAEMRAARGPGVVTGFFLHRNAPRQEIDIEIMGDDPRSMLVNVYYNPGDDLAAMNYGYRGAPCRVELGFDAAQDFHRYTIDWRPGLIVWSVDGIVVHERVGWDPSPVPHLPMRFYGNLWAPCSEDLAGRIDPTTLPARATFRNVAVWT